MSKLFEDTHPEAEKVLFELLRKLHHRAKISAGALALHAQHADGEDLAKILKVSLEKRRNEKTQKAMEGYFNGVIK